MKNAVIALRTFFGLALPYFRSEDRWRACGLLAGVVGSELFVVYVAVKMNEWNRTFFNAIEVRDSGSVRSALFIFIFITLGAILSGMGQFWFGQTLIIRWREWMTQRYVALWMADGRHYRIRFVDQSIDNIHLRIGNDVLLFVQRTHELGTGFLQSIVSLLSFAYILWGISLIAPLQLFGVDLAFPGYLIVLAIGYAALGTVVAHFIGWPLVPLQFRQQRFESDFRFALARVTDHADAVALMGGEPVERAELRKRFTALVRNWVSLVNRQNGLNGFIFGYFHVSTVFPVLIVTPAYLANAISLGVLMQASLAFQKVESAFAFCITSYAKIAEWRAVMNRVAQFEAAMHEVDRPGLPGAAIDIAPSVGDALSIRDLVLRLPSGEPIASVPALDLTAGERLLVSGPSGAGKSSLFRGLAGTWPLGGGRVRFPRGARVLALPQRPYFPLGSLRQALTYPMLADEVDDTRLREAMAEAGLEHLTDRLDEEAEWNTVLSGGEQQRAGFAHALIYQPNVLLLDEAVSTLQESEARDLYARLADMLPDTIVVSTGRSFAHADPHHRVMQMTGSPVAGRPPPRQAELVEVPA
jgi:vitamin B12/bleomycin/antimicrobial peptide transport system ATP-binding/permease protein